MKRGGAFIAQGAETCVFSPPVSCKPGTMYPPDPLEPGEYVSRLISKKNPELQTQFAVGDAIQRIHEMYPDVNLLDYMNFAVRACEPVLKQEELVNAKGKYCRPRDDPPLVDAAQQSEFVNLITPKQDQDIQTPIVVDGKVQIDPVTHRTKYTLTRPVDVTLSAVKLVVYCVALLNSEGMVHYDAHAGNIAWMGGRAVLHDWGRAMSEQQYRDTFFGLHAATPQSRANMKSYPQFYIPIFVLQKFVDGNGAIQLSENQKRLFFRLHDTLAIIGAMKHLVEPFDPEVVTRARTSTQIALTLIGYNFPVESAHDAIKILIDAFFEIPRSAETQANIDLYTKAVGPELVAAVGLLGLAGVEMQGGGMPLTSKFNRCVKSVKKTIQPRKGSTAESGAIAICTKSILHPRGRTIRSYTRNRLRTQRRI